MKKRAYLQKIDSKKTIFWSPAFPETIWLICFHAQRPSNDHVIITPLKTGNSSIDMGQASLPNKKDTFDTGGKYIYSV